MGKNNVDVASSEIVGFGRKPSVTTGKKPELLKQNGTYEKLDAITSRLIEGILQSAENNGIAINGGSVSDVWIFLM